MNEKDRISRKEFLKYAGAVGLGAVVVSTGCKKGRHGKPGVSSINKLAMKEKGSKDYPKV